MQLTRGKMLGALATTAVAGSLAGAWIGLPGGEQARAAAGSGADEVVVAHADDALPSVTGTDWVTHADQVAVVRPTAEKEIPASAEEKEAGEGYIGRSATLSLERVLWSRAGASAAPESVTLDVAGWTFKGEERHKFAVHDAPRLEQGHTYIVALAHEDDGSWSLLGSGGVLPYDAGTVGNGESEGVVHTVAKADKANRPLSVAARAGAQSDKSLEEQAQGRSAEALVSLLNSAKPEPGAR
ncbi:hypothetical protein QCN29_03180 [Streptomyces sp. HNM0663]|uniref:Secreted protein n=1 Tax=Streptomyces chengmaiensis TaxID=3040919 RepID=A0ABT6HGB5_9ACTN|nr:hypothetical protein [Streptomyces chengmaiensis]MDH2387807.1 hypothetical protein [Streptomyces chengmaiensis]